MYYCFIIVQLLKNPKAIKTCPFQTELKLHLYNPGPVDSCNNNHSQFSITNVNAANKELQTESMLVEHCLFSTVTNQIATSMHLELLELLLGSSSLGHLEDIEPHGLAEGSALSNYHDVANCDIPENRSPFCQQMQQVKSVRKLH